MPSLALQSFEMLGFTQPQPASKTFLDIIKKTYIDFLRSIELLKFKDKNVEIAGLLIFSMSVFFILHSLRDLHSEKLLNLLSWLTLFVGRILICMFAGYMMKICISNHVSEIQNDVFDQHYMLGIFWFEDTSLFIKAKLALRVGVFSMGCCTMWWIAQLYRARREKSILSNNFSNTTQYENQENIVTENIHDLTANKIFKRFKNNYHQPISPLKHEKPEKD